jgi:hypothetical protein
MKLISHRGNLEGSIKEMENHPNYIDKALSLGFDAEIDIHVTNQDIYLGHDSGQYLINLNWLFERRDMIWIHCKNIQAIELMYNSDLHFFWHQNDTLTVTSKKFIWAFPGNQPIENSVAVMPEIYDDNINSCIGICSDFILKYL